MLKSLSKKIAYLIATCIILAAVLVCIVRLITPILDNHRSDIETIASKLLQTPVKISNVRVSWYRYQPVIRLNNVTILNKETRQPVFKIKKVSLLISTVKSLWQWQVVPNGIMASGAELNVTESEKGEYKIKEFSTLPFNQQSQGEAKFTDLMTWLSEEPYLILSNIDVYYTGFAKQKRFITLYKLAFENSDTEHRISGKAILHQDIPTEVSVNAAWNGNISDIPNINVQTYLYVSGLSLPQWAKGFTLKGWQVKQGIVSAKIWANWQEGAFQKIQATFQSYGLQLYSNNNKTTHRINRMSGNIGWKQEGTSQIFAGDEILLDLPDHLWPVSSFSVSLAPDVAGTFIPQQINVGYLDIADVQPFLFSTPNLLPDSVMQMLTAMKARGALHNTVITLNNHLSTSEMLDLNEIFLTSNFSKLNFLAWKKIPGMKNVSGSIKWDGKEGEIKFASKNTEFTHADIFNHPVFLDQLAGEVKIGQDKDTWVININSLHILNNDMSANVNGTLKLPSNASPITDISANLAMKQVKNITNYLPTATFDKNLNEWLEQAFLAGEITSAHAILRGKLADFPFDKGKGEFAITAKANNIDFRFAPDWPILDRVKADLAFTGRKLTIDIDSAETLGIPISSVHGVIPYIGDKHPQILEVNAGKIETDFEQGMQYVHESPLEKNIGKMFSSVDLQGAIALKLDLIIPLKHPDDTKVKGDLSIFNSSMNMPAWNLKLSQLNGLLAFTENSTTAKNLRAVLFNKPLSFDLVTQQKPKNIIQAKFSNTFNVKDIQTWLKLPASNLVEGNVNMDAVIDLSMSEPITIHLQSNLVGASIDLATPYGKAASEPRHLSADIILQENKPLRIKMNYASLFASAVILERKQDKYNLIGANLRFGAGEIDWPPTAGIYITGEFDTLDWDKINTITSHSSGKNNTSSIPPSFNIEQLKGVDLHINKVNLSGQALTQVNLKAKPEGNNWNIRIDSPEITGQLIIPIHMTRQSLILAQFQKINLHVSSSETKAQIPIDVKSLPTLSLLANDVRYNDIPIGRIQFNASPSSAGLAIQNLRISSPNIELRATGAWKQGSKGYVTFLQGWASSTRVSRLLNSLGVDASNFVSSNGNLSFNLAWPDAPYAPSLANMNGRASLALGSGRIVDIGAENGAKMDLGRMLSIFSLQTIPRRLALDFSDVFQKGYSFDSLRGDFVIQNGELKTNNMRFDGPVAKVGINGIIGLKNKSYNFILSVTAHVTSSIPVAATLLTGNPLIGLGAFAVNTVLGSKMSGVTSNYYSVTGSWDNPVWKQIRRSR